GDLAAKVRANADASASRSASGTILLTRPRRYASPASKLRPENTSSNARRPPPTRGKWAKWMAGMTPTSISGNTNVARWADRMTSHDVASVITPAGAATESDAAPEL